MQNYDREYVTAYTDSANGEMLSIVADNENTYYSRQDLINDINEGNVEAGITAKYEEKTYNGHLTSEWSYSTDDGCACMELLICEDKNYCYMQFSSYSGSIDNYYIIAESIEFE